MQPLRGILFKIMSVMMFMGMASLIKAASDEVPPGQAVFFRSFFALPKNFFNNAITAKYHTFLDLQK